MKKESKIYVAGHTGLVGSAIWENLSSKGYLNLLGKTADELDLTNQKETAEFFVKEKPEYVFLAAARVGGIEANNKYRGQFIYENLMIQSNVIHQAYLRGVKKLLFLGSTCIYPKDCPQPIREDYLLTGPLEFTNEPYAIAKIAGMRMCESYNIQYGTNFISVMPTNLYGPKDNFDLEKSHVLPALIRKMHLGKCLEEGNWQAIRKDLDNRPLGRVSGAFKTERVLKALLENGIKPVGPSEIQVEIWGSGKPYREFLWSEDLADACVFIMETVDFGSLLQNGTMPAKSDEKKLVELRNKHINIGTGEEVSIKELTLLIKEVVGFNGSVHFNTNKPDGTMRKLTDVQKLHSLGWRHSVGLKDGIEKAYQWYLAKE